jgi:S1-C subfamily serine protease
MSYPGARQTLAARLAERARNPFVAALLGALVVLVVGAIAVGAGWVGKEEKTTVVQGSLGQTDVRPSGKGLTINEIYDRDGPGVVFIRAEIVRRVESPFGLLPQRERGEATGSGFVIDENGHILTNAHVVQGASRIEVRFGNEKTEEAKLVGRDPSNDLALLKVEAGKEQLKPLTLGDSSKVEVGDSVVAIGNPFGLDRTVTTGIVSALQRQLEAPNGFQISNVIQTDAAINPGNSGGPLIDARGRAIGINSQIATAGGQGNIGIGFAVPINKAKEIASELKKSGRVRHAFLGITGVSITSSLSERLNLPSGRGVLVQEATGPAKRAGLQGGDTQVSIGGQDIVLGGDVIVEIDGKRVESMNDVIELVDSKKPGDKVSLKVLRGSRSRTIEVELGNRPASVGAGSGGGGRSPEELLPPDVVP